MADSKKWEKLGYHDSAVERCKNSEKSRKQLNGCRSAGTELGVD
jgi:hypothetical protein